MKLFSRRREEKQPFSEQVAEAIQAFINTRTWAERRQVAEAYYDLLLTDTAEQIFAALIEYYSDDPDVIRVLKEHRELLTRCRHEGFDIVFSHQPHSPGRTATVQEIVKAIEDFVNAETWAESKRIVGDYRDLLLTDAADQVFAALIRQYSDDPGAERVLKEYYDLLACCREDGIDVAFADYLRLAENASATTAELDFILEALSAPTALSDTPRQVELCRAALKLVDETQQPEIWATLHAQLGNSLLQNPQGKQAENTKQAIHHCQKALEVFTREAVPEQWAMVQFQLGDAFVNNPLGDRFSNLQQAIQHYHQALEVFTHETYPESWVSVQRNLEVAYHRLLQIDATGKLITRLLKRYSDDPSAVRVLKEHHELLNSRQEEDHTDFDYLSAHRIPGVVQRVVDAVTSFVNAATWEESKRIVQVHHDELLMDAADKVLDHMLTQAKARADEEGVHDLLEHRALLRRCRHQGIDLAFADRVLPQEMAGVASQVVEAVTNFINAATWEESKRIVEAHRDELLTDAANQVFEYLVVQAKDRSDQEEICDLLEHRAFLRRCRHQGIDLAFADHLHPGRSKLATLLVELWRLTRPHDMPRRVEICHEALLLVDRDAQPDYWAQFHIELGDSLHNNPLGNRANNLEQAIEHYRQALEVYTREDSPRLWAAAHNNLGNAYLDRIRGDRAENIEHSIEHYRLTLEIYTREAFSDDWAGTQHNLGNAYRQRILGERADNLEQAIEYFQKALEVRTREALPGDWARTQHNLGAAYSERIRGEWSYNIEKAIEHLGLALEVRTRETFPQEWALSQLNLGGAYLKRISGERADNLEQAIEHYQQALMVYTREAFPEHWAAAQMNLGTAYLYRIRSDRADNIERSIEHHRLALEVYTREAFPERWAMTQNNLGNACRDRICGEPTDNTEQAIEHYKLALEIRTLDQFPSDCRRTLHNLGNLYFSERNWEEAYAAYVKAIEAGDTLLATAYTETGRQAEVGETTRVCARTAYSLLKMEQPAKAFLRLEQGKTRLLAEALALGNTDLDILPSAQRQAVMEARRAVHTFETVMRILPDKVDRRRGATEAAHMLRRARDNLNLLIETIRTEHPDFMPTDLDLPDILALIPQGGALVAPLVTPQGSAAFVVPHGVKTINAENVIWLHAFTEDELQILLRGPTQSPGWGSWMGAYLDYRSSDTRAAFENWQSTIETFTGRLWELLMGEIHERLKKLGLADSAPVTLLPQGGLGLLPLHAAWREVGGVKRAFLDDYTVSYAPSAYVLSVSRQHLQDERRHRPSLLAVVNPTADLFYTPIEWKMVTRLFADRQTLAESGATQKAVEEARGCTYLHFACHGVYDWRDAMRSGLLLASSNLFTVSEIISNLDLSVSRLITLSACETGLTEFSQSPDEYIGLPAGFLKAGAPGVVSSLWAVDDQSTALLMGRFYHEHLQERLQPAQALSAAQRWLRDRTRAELCEYLEPFVLMSPDEKRAAYADLLLGGASNGPFSNVQDTWVEEYFEFLLGGTPDDRPYAHPYFWAAFTFTGI